MARSDAALPPKAPDRVLAIAFHGKSVRRGSQRTLTRMGSDWEPRSLGFGLARAKANRYPRSRSSVPGVAMSDRRKPLTYADAGVDIDIGNRLLDRIRPLARATRRA